MYRNRTADILENVALYLIQKQNNFVVLHEYQCYLKNQNQLFTKDPKLDVAVKFITG